jgi:hypothetical protein
MWDEIVNIFETLKRNFIVDYDMDFSYDFSRLEVFSHRNINTGPVIKLNNQFQTFHLAFIRVAYSYIYEGRFPCPPTFEYQTWAVCTWKNDFGHILIKP